MFEDSKEPIDYVTLLSQSMHFYPPTEILSANFLYHEWDQKLVHKFLSFITPENMRVHLVSKKFSEFVTNTEKWYGTKYLEFAFNSTQLEVKIGDSLIQLSSHGKIVGKILN